MLLWLIFCFIIPELIPPTRSAMLIVSTVSVQYYPILTFMLMTNYRRRTKTKKPSPNESALKLNVLPTITEPKMV
jgi:hypothetical protein